MIRKLYITEDHIKTYLQFSQLVPMGLMECSNG